MSDVRQEIRHMILNSLLGSAPDAALGDDESLDRAHIVDSVRALELLLFVEEQFGITVERSACHPNFASASCR